MRAVHMASKFIDGIEVIVSDVDQYLQINDISSSDLIKIWDHIKTNYPLYEKWICYHNYIEIPFALLDEIGAVLEDDSIELRLSVDGFIRSKFPGIVLITEENFDKFAIYHNKCNPENGANSERIKRNFFHWAIFALFTDNRITDYIILFTGSPNQAEIYCVEASDNVKCRELITSAANHAFEHGKKEVLFMADENTIEHEQAISIGFVNTGFYKGYEIKQAK